MASWLPHISAVTWIHTTVSDITAQRVIAAQILDSLFFFCYRETPTHLLDGRGFTGIRGWAKSKLLHNHQCTEFKNQSLPHLVKVIQKVWCSLTCWSILTTLAACHVGEKVTSPQKGLKNISCECNLPLLKAAPQAAVVIIAPCHVFDQHAIVSSSSWNKLAPKGQPLWCIHHAHLYITTPFL